MSLFRHQLFGGRYVRQSPRCWRRGLDYDIPTGRVRPMTDGQFLITMPMTNDVSSTRWDYRQVEEMKEEQDSLPPLGPPRVWSAPPVDGVAGG